MRGKHIKKRLLEPDDKYGSINISKLINYILKNGKKEVAKKIVYQALEGASEKLKTSPLSVLDQAIKNASPLIEVRSYRVGGANYQVPMEVPKHRRISLALNWMIKIARSKKGANMKKKLQEEIISVYNNEGATIKKKEDTHKMAEANRAFAHFGRR